MKRTLVTAVLLLTLLVLLSSCMSLETPDKYRDVPPELYCIGGFIWLIWDLFTTSWVFPALACVSCIFGPILTFLLFGAAQDFASGGWP